MAQGEEKIWRDSEDLHHAWHCGEIITHRPFNNPLLNTRADHAIRNILSNPASPSTKVAFMIEEVKISPEIKARYLFGMVRHGTKESALSFFVPRDISDSKILRMLEWMLEEKKIPLNNIVTVEERYKPEMESYPPFNHIQRVIVPDPLDHMCHAAVIFVTTKCLLKVTNNCTTNLSDAFIFVAWSEAVSRYPPQWELLSKGLQLYFEQEKEIGSDIEEEI